MIEPRDTKGSATQIAASALALDRRMFLGLSALLGGASMFGFAQAARAKETNSGDDAANGAAAEVGKYQKELDTFLGGAELKMERVTLTAPEIAENGNTVPIGVTVDSPMTPDNHVVSILILADGNPEPGVAKLNFSKYSAEAMARTRIRLAKTQNITAIAKMSDGTFYADKKYVKVTIGGCGG